MKIHIGQWNEKYQENDPGLRVLQTWDEVSIPIVAWTSRIATKAHTTTTTNKTCPYFMEEVRFTTVNWPVSSCHLKLRSLSSYSNWSVSTFTKISISLNSSWSTVLFDIHSCEKCCDFSTNLSNWNFDSLTQSYFLHLINNDQPIKPFHSFDWIFSALEFGLLTWTVWIRYNHRCPAICIVFQL